MNIADWSAKSRAGDSSAVEGLSVCGWTRGESPHPVYAEFQVEHDGLRLGVCLAIAERLHKYPTTFLPGMRTSLTPKQQEAVDAFLAKR